MKDDHTCATPEEFTQWCERKNLSIPSAADVLGMSRSMGYKYANGEATVSLPVSFQMEVLDLLSPTQLSRIITKRVCCQK